MVVRLSTEVLRGRDVERDLAWHADLLVIGVLRGSVDHLAVLELRPGASTIGIREDPRGVGLDAGRRRAVDVVDLRSGSSLGLDLAVADGVARRRSVSRVRAVGRPIHRHVGVRRERVPAARRPACRLGVGVREDVRERLVAGPGRIRVVRKTVRPTGQVVVDDVRLQTEALGVEPRSLDERERHLSVDRGRVGPRWGVRPVEDVLDLVELGALLERLLVAVLEDVVGLGDLLLVAVLLVRDLIDGLMANSLETSCDGCACRDRHRDAHQQCHRSGADEERTDTPLGCGFHVILFSVRVLRGSGKQIC